MALKISYFYKNLTVQEKKQAEAYMTEKLERIEKQLYTEEAFLRVRIEKFAKKSAYNVELEMRAPKQKYMASEDDHTISEAIDFALDKLVKQLKRARGFARPSHHKYPRARAVKTQWEALEAMAAQPEEEDAGRAEFFAQAEKLVQPLVRTLQHEIRLRGLEGEEDVAAETILNDALLAIWDARKRKPRNMTFRQRLYQAALGILDERARALRKEEPRSLEEIMPEESEASQVSNLGDEVKDFWQPDELTRLADTIGTPVRKGGLAPSQKAQYHRVLAALSNLNPQARQAFFLRYKEGFDADEIAMIQRRKLVVVEKDLRETLEFLQTKLS